MLVLPLPPPSPRSTQEKTNTEIPPSPLFSTTPSPKKTNPVLLSMPEKSSDNSTNDNELIHLSAKNQQENEGVTKKELLLPSLPSTTPTSTSDTTIEEAQSKNTEQNEENYEKWYDNEVGQRKNITKAPAAFVNHITDDNRKELTAEYTATSNGHII